MRLMKETNTRRGFTLIELLVVIAIIALLIGILLPTLARARQQGRMLKSLANCRSLLTAQAMYKSDNKERPPNRMSRKGGSFGWSSWSFAGKSTSDYWLTNPAGAAGVFDEPAVSRPLNEYLVDLRLQDPIVPTKLGAPANKLPWKQGTVPLYEQGTPTDRGLVQIEVCKSPGDIFTRQRQWPNPTLDLSSYDDVGTSYHVNTKWFSEIYGPITTDFENAFNFGIRRMMLAADYDTSKFVWIHDQTLDIVANYTGPSTTKFEGEFGDLNRSVVAFLDGHAKYIVVDTGKASGKEYSLYFDPNYGK